MIEQAAIKNNQRDSTRDAQPRACLSTRVINGAGLFLRTQPLNIN